MKDHLQKAYCMNQTCRIYAAITTHLSQEAQKIHHLWPTSAAALSRTLTISAIMSCTYKSQERLTIKITGDGPVCPITVEASDGAVRGYVHNPGVFLTYSKGGIAVKEGVGNSGMIEVIKDLHMRIPFSSSAPLKSGEIAEDFTYYFALSEQIPSSVGLGEKFDREGNLIASGGFLLQVMPGCSEEHIARLEKKLASLKSCAEMIEQGYTPEDIIDEITDGDYQILETKELNYFCPCSRNRFEKGLLSLGKQELLQILKEDHKASLTCQFCNKTYEFDEKDLQKLIDSFPKSTK